MGGTVSSEGTESSGLKQFVWVAIGALILIWFVAYLADKFFEPEELAEPAYYIEVPGGPSKEERLQAEVDLVEIQRGWPINSSENRVKLEEYMARLKKGEIVVAAAPADTAAAPAKAAKPEIVPDLGTLLASANAEKGARVARKCASCHTFNEGGRNSVGPNLWGVIGAPKARLGNFNYSNAMREAGGAWDFESLNEYLRKPSKYIRGTRMAFAGIRKDADRANLLAYMRNMASSPVPLPAPTETPEEALEEADSEGAKATAETP